MITKYCEILLFIVILFLLKINFLEAQDYSQNSVSSYCAMNTPSNYDVTFPIKPPVTGEHYMRIILVYVMFNNETFQFSNENWLANTTTGPSYMGTMLAQTKNDIPDWWNAYSTDNQSISSWFCENSRGQTHVIGDEYFVKLPLSAEEYMDINNFPFQKDRENAINSYIYENLTYQQHVTLSLYDNWSYSTNSGWSWGSDGKIDMIYKVHRYNYYVQDREIFSVGQFSGICELGYGRSSNSNHDFDYIIIQNDIDYHFIGKQYFYTQNYDVIAGSGLTVVGNGASGVLNKMGTLGRLMHENGHYFFGGGHSYVGMMGDAWDLSYCPYEKMMLEYVTPKTSNWENNGYEEVILDDYSARTNGNNLLVVKMPDREFIIANRNKVSRWDRIMNGDVAYFGLDTYHGKGAYIYHNGTNHFYYPNQAIDIECADGLWKWVQDGYDAPDWNPTKYFLPVLNRTDAVRFPNYQNDDGSGVNINTYPDIAKDGLTVRGFGIPDPGKPIPTYPKYFSKGKKGINETNSGCGWDRIEVNIDNENWTSRENMIDRWDAWKPGYNEMFSPYSSPSTIEFGGQQTGTFIWIKNYNESSNQMTIRIYRDVVYNTGGWLESDILAATPPSRPMGIKHNFYYPINGSWCIPQITWQHNTEPDMEQGPSNAKFKRYQVYRVTAPNMSYIPDENNYVLIASNVDIPINDIPHYEDFSVLEWDCALLDQVPPYGTQYPIRYRVKAVDLYNTPSVMSDFASTTGISQDGDRESSTGNNSPSNQENIPKKYDLYQNYPNPFNPVTKINFDLPKDSKVSLIVYDILGREIARLINGEMRQAGRYMIDFNGSNLSSGVYFYRLLAGDFVSVKRMLLIK